MNVNRAFRPKTFLKQAVAASLLTLLLIPCGLAQPAPPPPYNPMGVDQLNQLVAPIALYPDSLVAQILTAATYPQQVADANNWVNQNMGMPPEQRAAMVDTMPWDPSVKALTAFPSVLNNLARNYEWSSALGNAYYNQPGDVMNAVQAMRIRAQEAGMLRSDSHYRVAYNDGLVVIEPYAPGMVYVPYYNPWAVYGGPIVAWPGYYYISPPRGIALVGGFGFVGISIGLFSHYGWGYHSWAPNWHGGVVVYNHTTYISRSTTVINRGNFGGYNRGVYEHGGAGIPHNFRPAVTSQSAAFHASRPGEFRGSSYSNQRPGTPTSPGGRQFGQPAARPVTPSTSTGGRQFGQPGAATTSRPATGTYNRPSTSTYTRPGGGGTTPSSPGNYSRPNTPSNTYSRPSTPSNYSRPATSYSRPATPTTPSGPSHNTQQSYRPAAMPQNSAPSHTQSQPSHTSSGGNSGGGQHSQPQNHNKH